MSESEICKFYDDQNVFITGGTGFVGKVLIEKLLRSTNVALIYVLIRDKKGKNVRTRIEELLENKLFSKLKDKNPNFKNRVRIVPGDTSFPNLGLSEEMQEELSSAINIVFHVAATVRFDVNLKEAYDINVKGTAQVVELCKTMKELKAFVHVSTAYINCPTKCTEEVFPEFANHKQLMNILDKGELPEMDTISSRFLEKWPNTYNFTKALAELLVRDQAQHLPVAVFRPAIVSATRKEPIEGWIDNYGGATSVVASLSFGFARLLPLDKNLKAELVPVDMCVSAMIAVAWEIGTQNARRVPIYNYVSSVDNPITWLEIIHLLKVQFYNCPMNNLMWKPKIVAVKKNEWHFSFLNFLYHYLPATLIDLTRILCLKKPQMVGRYKTMDYSLESLRFVTEKEWQFTNDNTKKLWGRMNGKDKEIFPFDFDKLHWLKYIRDYYYGIRLYIFKDPLDTLPVAKTRANTLQLVNTCLKIILYYLGTKLIWTLVQKAILYHRRRKWN